MVLEGSVTGLLEWHSSIGVLLNWYVPVVHSAFQTNAVNNFILTRILDNRFSSRSLNIILSHRYNTDAEDTPCYTST
jgi:hypothetical protein